MKTFDDDAFKAWSRSEPVQDLLRDLWEAVETARANAPATREAARTALGEAVGAFLEGIGATEQLRQQMVDHVFGEPGADAAFAGKTFEELTWPNIREADLLREAPGLNSLRARRHNRAGSEKARPSVAFGLRRRRPEP